MFAVLSSASSALRMKDSNAVATLTRLVTQPDSEPGRASLAAVVQDLSYIASFKEVRSLVSIVLLAPDWAIAGGFGLDSAQRMPALGPCCA